MALAINKIIKDNKGKPSKIEIITQNRYGELAIITFVRRGDTVRVASVRLLNRTVIEDESEFWIPKKEFVACVRLAKKILLFNPHKHKQTSKLHHSLKKQITYYSLRDPHSCPYCGYLDPGLVSEIKKGKEVDYWKCPNCGRTYHIPNDKPLYWRKKKKKGGEK